MNFIHTFFPVGNTLMTKGLLNIMTLSVLSVKKHYPNSKFILYTNEEVAKIVKNVGIPYDIINDELLEGLVTKTFSIPKLVVYSDQTEPYIHVDLDSFIFERMEFNGDVIASFEEGKRPSGIFMKHEEIYITYVEPIEEIKDKLPVNFYNNLTFDNIPNMCLFGGNDYKLISNASKLCLEIYNNNRLFFDSDYSRAAIIEQLFIGIAIKTLSSTKFTYLFNDSLPDISYMDSENFIVIENKSNNFDGFLHLGGYKFSYNVQALIKSKISDEPSGSILLNNILSINI